MDLNLESKRALVCGSSQGIGRAIALELAEEGVEVTLFARNKLSLEKVLGELKQTEGKTHRILVADFTKPKEVAVVLESDIAEHGAHDIVINNTGGPKPGPAHQADLTEYIDAFRLHLITNQVIASQCIPHMKEKCFGRIINIISTSVKQPLDNLGVSNTIRGAVANWAKTLSNELGQFGITVNNVLPGATETARLEAIISKKSETLNISRDKVIESDHKIIPMRRYGTSQEVASAVTFLASERAGYITGVNLPVDGGRTKSL